MITRHRQGFAWVFLDKYNPGRINYQFKTKIYQTDNMTAPANPFPTLKKVESFFVIEEKPPCNSPVDRLIQEVIRPAMLVKDEKGQKYLIFSTHDDKSP